MLRKSRGVQKLFTQCEDHARLVSNDDDYSAFFLCAKSIKGLTSELRQFPAAFPHLHLPLQSIPPGESSSGLLVARQSEPRHKLPRSERSVADACFTPPCLDIRHPDPVPAQVG